MRSVNAAGITKPHRAAYAKRMHASTRGLEQLPIAYKQGPTVRPRANACKQMVLVKVPPHGLRKASACKQVVLVKAPPRGLRKASACKQVVLVKAPPRGLRKAMHAPVGVRLVSGWCPVGVRLVSGWCPAGFRLVCNWCQPGVRSVGGPLPAAPRLLSAAPGSRLLPPLALTYLTGLIG